MSVKLIVTGLCEEIRDEELYDLFDAYGPIVDVGVERDALTSRPLGVGYVVYGEPLSAARARLCMDGAEVNGRILCVQCESAPCELEALQALEDEPATAPLNDAGSGPPARNLRARFVL
jgi:hypothetical protein